MYHCCHRSTVCLTTSP